MKAKILQEFIDSDIKITSQEKLEQYIEYCIYKNKNTRVKDEEEYSLSSYHHILPKALFPEYKDLKENSWNGTHLLYSDHYYAHWLLTEAIDDYGMLSAFCAMHNKDTKLKRIEEKDLIPADEFQMKMEEKGKGHSEWYKNNPEKVQEAVLKREKIRSSEIWKETVGTKMKEKMRTVHKNNPAKRKILLKWHKNNPEESKNARRKAIITLFKKDKNGLSGYQKIGLKASETKNSREWKETKGKESTNKQKKTKNSKEWKETVGKESVNKQKKTKDSKEWKETVGKEAKKKYSETINKEFKNSFGEITTINKQSTESQKRTITTEFIGEDGSVTTIAKEAGKKLSAKLNSKEYKENEGKLKSIKVKKLRALKGKWFIIKKEDKIIYNIITNREISDLSQSLAKTSKEKYLGMTLASKRELKKNNKEFMIGWYVEEIYPSEKEKDDYLDKNTKRKNK